METLLQAATLIERPPCSSFATFIAPSGYKMGDAFNVVTCHGVKLSFTAKRNGNVMHLPVTRPVKITHTQGAGQLRRVEEYIRKRNRAEARRKMIIDKCQQATNEAVAKKRVTALHSRAQLLQERVANVEASGDFRAERDVREPRHSPSVPPLPHGVGLFPSARRTCLATRPPTASASA